MGKLENAENSVLLSVGEDFPGGPVVRILPFSAGGTGLIPEQEAIVSHTTWCCQKKFFKKLSNITYRGTVLKVDPEIICV